MMPNRFVHDAKPDDITFMKSVLYILQVYKKCLNKGYVTENLINNSVIPSYNT